MNTEELRRIRDQEREKDSLQHLPAEFYSDVGNYLSELRTERDQAAASSDDPFADPTVRRLNDDLDRAERTVESLYERRVGKIVKLASFEAADMSTEAEGLTDEERELCDAIVARIRENRERILATITASEDTVSVPDDSYARGATENEEELENAPAETSDSASPSPDTERTTVRITTDLGEIVGIDDRTYDLAADDVVSLPTKNAQPLLERGAAEAID